jgi:hypothetical protein
MRGRRRFVGRAVIVWFAASVAAIVVGMLIASAASGVGTILAVGGIVSLVAFLLFGWWRATTENDQWVWQTPHKPRREYLADEAAKAASDSTDVPRDAAG